MNDSDIEDFLAELDKEIEGKPSVCGVIEDDVPCTAEPEHMSKSECCGWIDVACTEHKNKLGALFEDNNIDCGDCGHGVNLIWHTL